MSCIVIENMREPGKSLHKNIMISCTTATNWKSSGKIELGNFLIRSASLDKPFGIFK
ncbi:hypothetical protein ACI6PS_00620 [Flavobacterium sp. PLA-1-15]|uniref:hypothetical protein n=1 Tax=Flavobacterium sp. PLA-1-15 TaxID=3380533 RepID=UPI003B78CF96